MKQPSIEWKEVIEPGEKERFEGFAAQIVAMQQRKAAKYGNGRALHRKAIVALDARFEVAANVPEQARHGLFAKPGAYDARIRLSNGSMNRQSDATPDIRGYGIKILGVDGPAALGEGPAKSQDFILINHEGFGFPRAEPFIGVIMAAARGPFALIAHLVKTFGLSEGLSIVKKLVVTQKAPFSGFASEKFFSAAPIKCGPYAARVRLLPAVAPEKKKGSVDWQAELQRHVAAGPLVHQLQLQFFVDEATTPIEDATSGWPESEAPFVTVGTLTIPVQPLTGDAAAERNNAAERAAFDPWNALADHRPLGNVMRARQYAYFGSERQRGAE